jgi:hypothetical protein
VHTSVHRLGLERGPPEARKHIEPPKLSKVSVVIENHMWSDLTAYLVRDGVRFRLGRVGSQEREQFDVGRFLGSATSYGLQADPLGSAPIVSENVQSAPAAVVRWTLGAKGWMSAVTVR